MVAVFVATRLWPAEDPDEIEHTHDGLDADHPHLSGATSTGQGYRYSHAFVIDSHHSEWPSEAARRSMTEHAVYGGLFLTALVAATILLMQSEVALVGFSLADAYPLWALLTVASIGNLLGFVFLTAATPSVA